MDSHQRKNKIFTVRVFVQVSALFQVLFCVIKQKVQQELTNQLSDLESALAERNSALSSLQEKYSLLEAAQESTNRRNKILTVSMSL